MEITLDQFVRDAIDNSLVSADDMAAARDSLPPEKRGSNATALAKVLIQIGKLTKYQAAAIYQGKAQGLVYGNYVVLDRLGAGGMGVVYKARHRTMDRVVALKVLSPKVVDSSPDAVKRFQQEVRAAAQLNHAHIVKAHDADQRDNVHYLVMEYVEGEDLEDRLKRDGRLPIEQAINCIVQAAKGLEYAHRKGIIHRDIKPANLLIDHEGTVKILDMGLARMDNTVGAQQGKAGQPSRGLTQSGQIMGTCDYMAPEQAMDTKHATARSDIYSLGCTLFRLLTGHPPYGGDTIMKILMGHQKEPVPSLREERPDVPPALETVYQQMMAKDPAQRPQTATEAIADLQACLGPAAAAPPAKKPPHVSGSSRVSGPAKLDSELDAFLHASAQPGVATAGAVQTERAGDTIDSIPDQDTDGQIGEQVASESGRRSRPPLPPPPPIEPATKAPPVTARGLPAKLAQVRAKLSSLTVEQKRLVLFGGIGLVAVVSLIGIVVLAIVLTAETPWGTIVVEAEDDRVQVAVLQGGQEIQLVDTDNNWTLRVDQGEYQLELRGGEDKFELDQQTVTVTRNSEVRVRVERKPEPLTEEREPLAPATVPLETDQADNEEASDESSLTVGQWVPLLADEEQFARWRIAYSKAGDVTFRNGELIVTARGGPPDVMPLYAVEADHPFIVHAEHHKQGFKAGLGLFIELCEYGNAHFDANTFELWRTREGRHGQMLTRYVSEESAGEQSWGRFDYVFLDGRLAAYANGKLLYSEPVDEKQLTHVCISGRESTTRWRNIALMRLTDEQADAVREGRLPVYESAPAEIAGSPPVDSAADPPPELAVASFDSREAKEHQLAWADYLRMPLERDIELPGGEKLTMVLIPPGEFLMGSTPKERARFLEKAMAAKDDWAIPQINSEGPQHQVRITRPYYLGKYEVTQAQWQAVMGSNPAKFNDNPASPVEQVSWDDTQPFLAKLSETAAGGELEFALPTEAQWEYACRAGTATPWHSGDSEAALPYHGWFDTKSYGKTHPVGQLRPNGFGLHDMHGNVNEWCSDSYVADYYANSPVDDPSGPVTGVDHTVRGGVWGYVAWFCRSAHRGMHRADFRGNSLGFRLAAAIRDTPESRPAGPAASASNSSAARPAARPPAEDTALGRHCLRFDGDDSRVLVDGFRYDGSHPITLEAWVTLNPEGRGNVISNLEDSGIALGVFDRQVWLSVHNGKDYLRAASRAEVQPQETHIAGVFDGRELRVYLNGELHGPPRPFHGKFRPSPLPLLVGANPEKNGAINAFAGTIDEVRISSVARYDSSFTPRRRHLPDKDTRLLYHFDEGSGETVEDLSGRNHQGKIVGAVWSAEQPAPPRSAPGAAAEKPTPPRPGPAAITEKPPPDGGETAAKRLAAQRALEKRKADYLRTHATLTPAEYRVLFSGACEQKNTKDCYLLAALGAIPACHREALFRTSIEKTSEGAVVKFPLGVTESQHSILVRPTDLQPQVVVADGQHVYHPVKSSPGWQILEAAYILAIHGRDSLGQVHRKAAFYGNASVVMLNLVKTKIQLGITVHQEPGLGTHPLQAQQVIFGFNGFDPTRHMMCVTSLDQAGSYAVGDFSLLPKHVYTVAGVDSRRRRVMIVNPYNSNQPFVMTYDQVLAGFRKFSRLEIDLENTFK